MAGHLSRKFGLLDGNFFGVRSRGHPPLAMNMFHYTTDVDFSVRTWSRDGGFFRCLGTPGARVHVCDLQHLLA